MNSATSGQEEMTNCILIRKEMMDGIEQIQQMMEKMGSTEIGSLHLQLLIIIRNIQQEQQMYCKSISTLPYPDQVKDAKIKEESYQDNKRKEQEETKNSALKQGVKLIINQEDEKLLLDPLKKDVLIEQRLLLESSLRDVILNGGEDCDEALALENAIEDIDFYLKTVYN